MAPILFLTTGFPAFLFAVSTCATTFTIPSTAPATAAVLDPAPLALSIEFFTFPSYFLNVSNTFPCIEQLEGLSGNLPPLRIGGTTQDRAVYDPSLNAYVDYYVPNATMAPSNLTFGPSFMQLAGTYKGRTIVGLNRGHDNLTNTILAAKSVVAGVPASSLYAIELGNEPDLYLGNGQEIATNTGTWSPVQDADSEATWQIAVGEALNKTSIIQAGNFVSGPPTWSAAELVANEDPAALQYIRDWSHHNYRQGGSSANLQLLMKHSDIAANIATYAQDLAVAQQTGKDYVIGETNSVSGGGAATVSPTMGGALWVFDFALRATSAGIKRIYYHFGTVGNCAYCWFGRGTVSSPWYGAYAAAAAFADACYIAALDDGSSLLGAYTLYRDDGTPMRVVIYNSEFFNGTTSRSVQNVTLEGLGMHAGVTARRLTAENALARQDQGHNPTFAGQTWANATCQPEGKRVIEHVKVHRGVATIEVGASEAVIVDLPCKK